jgi:hypothetical protein
LRYPVGSLARACAREMDSVTKRTRPMAEHKHGEMDVKEQEKTFEGFIRYTIWGIVVSIGILLFLAIFNS